MFGSKKRLAKAKAIEAAKKKPSDDLGAGFDTPPTTIPTKYTIPTRYDIYGYPMNVAGESIGGPLDHTLQQRKAEAYNSRAHQFSNTWYGGSKDTDNKEEKKEEVYVFDHTIEGSLSSDDKFKVQLDGPYNAETISLVIRMLEVHRSTLANKEAITKQEESNRKVEAEKRKKDENDRYLKELEFQRKHELAMQEARYSKPIATPTPATPSKSATEVIMNSGLKSYAEQNFRQ